MFARELTAVPKTHRLVQWIGIDSDVFWLYSVVKIRGSQTFVFIRVTWRAHENPDDWAPFPVSLIQLVVGRLQEATFLTGAEVVWLKGHRLGHGRGNDIRMGVHPKFYLQVWGPWRSQMQQWLETDVWGFQLFLRGKTQNKTGCDRTDVGLTPGFKAQDKDRFSRSEPSQCAIVSTATNSKSQKKASKQERKSLRTQVPRRALTANGTIFSYRFDDGTPWHISDPTRMACSANNLDRTVDYPLLCSGSVPNW